MRQLQLHDRGLEARIKVALGGRAAEEIAFGDHDDGAEGDIAVDGLARHMVGRWGMSATIGMLAVLPPDGRPPRGGRFLAARRSSSWTRRFAGSSRQPTTRSWRCSSEERERLDALAEALLERETLDQIDAYRVAGLAEPQTLPVD